MNYGTPVMRESVLEIQKDFYNKEYGYDTNKSVVIGEAIAMLPD
jgi:hypothetical protein